MKHISDIWVQFGTAITFIFFHLDVYFVKLELKQTMGSESNSASSSSTSSPCGKRARDPEDEVYLDNLHSHKRYLSEVRFLQNFRFFFDLLFFIFTVKYLFYYPTVFLFVFLLSANF